tara:strand:- start:54 stop:293 length:240 start_codon:yes stop_codon:yes gene_type:complete
MIDIDKNLKIFYEREENKEDEYIGAISKHECVVDGWFVIELLEEVKRLREDIIYALDNFMFVNGELEAFLKEILRGEEE